MAGMVPRTGRNVSGTHGQKQGIVPQTQRHVPQRAAGISLTKRHVPQACRGFAYAVPRGRIYGYGTRHRRTDGTAGNMKIKYANHRCGQPIIAALDRWICAISVTCDPWPLSPAGEVQALRAGRRTYQVRQWGVQHRTAYRIAGNPPGPRTTVLAEHTCGEVVPKSWRQPLPKKPTHNTQEVPF